MKRINFIFGLIALLTFSISCSNNENKNENTAVEEQNENLNVAENKDIVKVVKANLVYFHFTRRCATCNAISSVTNEVVADFTNKASFTEYNLDETEGQEMGKKLNINEQALLLLYGDNEIDLTEEAFINAKSNPEKFKQILKEKLTAVLL